MPLSQSQKEQLYKMIKSEIPNWEISGWLIDVCLLSPEEAYDVRRIGTNEIQNQKQAEQIEQAKRLEREKEIEEARDEREGAETIGIEKEEDQACISCGNKELNCDCEVKTVEQIPF